MLSIGMLDRKIRVEVKAEAQDTMGGYEISWDVWIATVSAYIEFKSGKETDSNERLNEMETVIFYVRNIGASIKSLNAYKYRILYPMDNQAVIDASTEHYYITAVQEYGGRDRFLKILTDKRTSNDRKL